MAILLGNEKEFDSPEKTARPNDLIADLIAAVRAGLPLLVLAQSAAGADAAAKALAKAGAFEYAGMAGASRGCWMGNWVFLKDHPAYAGLPSNQVMKWEYQVDFKDASGLLVDAPRSRSLPVTAAITTTLWERPPLRRISAREPSSFKPSAACSPCSTSVSSSTPQNSSPVFAQAKELDYGCPKLNMGCRCSRRCTTLGATPFLRQEWDSTTLNPPRPTIAIRPPRLAVAPIGSR
jgi:hypothetical protein